MGREVPKSVRRRQGPVALRGQGPYVTWSGAVGYVVGGGTLRGRGPYVTWSGAVRYVVEGRTLRGQGPYVT